MKSIRALARNHSEDRNDGQGRHRYLRLQRPNRDIRLLCIHPGTFNDPIHIELLKEPINLDTKSHREYEALSYVWGPRDNPVAVKMDQRTFSITRNLFIALRHLRHHSSPRIMWIDAICIDQSNSKERSAQVAMMGKIFSCASCVVVWLGPEADNSGQALKVLANIGSQVEVDWVDLKMSPSFDAVDNTLCDVTKPLPIAKSDAESIELLLKRDWFERLWVRQEVALARQAVIHVGMQCITWANFKSAVHCVLLKRGTADVFGLVTSRLYLVHDACASGRHYRLWQLRDEMNLTKCEDLRDKLNGALGLLDPHAELGITPDYDKSAEKVFQEATWKCIQHFQVNGLLILSSCDSLDPQRLPRLRSWVPDFAANLRFRFNPTSTPIANLPQLAELQKDGVLRVTGVHCGTITHKVDVSKNSAREIFRAIVRVCDEFTLSQDNIDAVCYATLFGGFRDEFTPPNESLPDFTESRNQVARFVANPAIIDDTDLWDLDLWAYAMTAEACIWGLSYFETDRGQLGVGPAGLEPGDRICQVFGCENPIMLRPRSGNQYHVLGPCYVCGIMNGEPILGPLPSNIQKKVCLNEVGYSCRYVNLDTKEIGSEDPRLQKLGINPMEKKRIWARGRYKWVPAHLDILKQSGVNPQNFDLA